MALEFQLLLNIKAPSPRNDGYTVGVLVKNGERKNAQWRIFSLPIFDPFTIITRHCEEVAPKFNYAPSL